MKTKTKTKKAAKNKDCNRRMSLCHEETIAMLLDIIHGQPESNNPTEDISKIQENLQSYREYLAGPENSGDSRYQSEYDLPKAGQLATFAICSYVIEKARLLLEDEDNAGLSVDDLTELVFDNEWMMVAPFLEGAYPHKNKTERRQCHLSWLFAVRQTLSKSQFPMEYKLYSDLPAEKLIELILGDKVTSEMDPSSLSVDDVVELCDWDFHYGKLTQAV